MRPSSFRAALLASPPLFQLWTILMNILQPLQSMQIILRCHVEFRDRYSPSFSVCFHPFSFILHPFPSILCYSPMLFHPLPSPCHTPLFRHTPSFHHTPSHSVIPSHSVTSCHFRHIPSSVHSSICICLFRLILSSFHIGIRLYRVLTSTFILAPFLFQSQPLSFRLRRVPAFYCIPTFIVL